MHRYLFENIKKDLSKKAILLSGPRQVGKTTFAKSLAEEGSEYLNLETAVESAAVADLTDSIDFF